MGGFAFLVRFILAAVAFVFLVLLWAVSPFTSGGNLLGEEGSGFLSVFFGTAEPTWWPRNLILLARASLGMAVVMFVFVPGLQFFVEFRAYMYRNTLVIFFVGVAVAAFLAALVGHLVFTL